MIKYYIFHFLKKMCGIFFCIGKNFNKHKLYQCIKRLIPRGPDDIQIHEVNISDLEMIFGFTRLSIVGLTEFGNQPLKYKNWILICNGEIYNYKKLANEYDFEDKLFSGSDCEVIIHLVEKIGIEKTVDVLDGVFSFVLVNTLNSEFYVARDSFGVRPLFIGFDDNDNLYFSSELKSLYDVCNFVEQYKPGHFTKGLLHMYKDYDLSKKFKNTKLMIGLDDEKFIMDTIRELLTNAVDKRMMSDRPIGCLLSGGLDSSLVTALVNRHFDDYELNTFSIGLSGSTDLHYAQIVAKHCKTNHHHIELEVNDFLDAIDKVIYAIESYETTTVRASVGNYLVSRYISENTDCKVIFNGDGSEEIFGSYIYLSNAPSPLDFQMENEKLINEIHYFDVLRSDRCISSNGLEARTPFLDKDLVSFVMSIHPSVKMHKNRIEKYILRKAFDSVPGDFQLLPDEILWRKKEAFSDGVSSNENSWFKIIQEHVDTIISDEEFKNAQEYTHCTPQLKETFYYRKIFEKHFGKKCENVVPHYWLPNFVGNVIDPSARVLENYKKSKNI